MKPSPALCWFTAALMLASLAGCQKKAAPLQPQVPPPLPSPAAPAKIVSAEPTSFDAVTRHLDPGGSFYLYLSTESFIKSLSEKWAEAGPLLFSAVTCKIDDEAAKAKAQAFWQSASVIAARCGLNEITGVGASSIAMEPGYYQGRWMVHHAPDKANGLIWKIGGNTPNALDFVSYLPEKTALGSSGNLKLQPIWEALTQEAAINPDLKQKLDLASQKFQQSTGLDLAALIASLGPNYSLAVTLDESRMASLPGGTGQPPVTFPEPALALFIQVQDDVLINRIDQQLAKNPQAVRTQEDGLTLCTLNLPLPMSYLHPTVAWKKGCLILASNDAIIREMMAVKAGKKPGFAANADFQKLRAGMPENGCKFAYVSPLFFKTMRSLQTMQVEHNQAATPAVKNLMQYIYRVSPQNEFYSVRQETEEGWIGIVHQKVPVPAGK